MEISKLYEMQRLLDDVILNNYFDRKSKDAQIKKLANDIDHYISTGFLTEKILALQTEVSELANETRCFKYWSTKQGEYDREKALKEYVDVLHFFLSVGNALKFTPEEVVQAYSDKNNENYIRQITGY